MTFIVNANDRATVLSDADEFFSSYFAATDDDEATNITRGFGVRAARYLQRLGRIAGALLANRDDKRHFPIDPFRGRVMPAWGAFTEDRDGEWNTDVVTSGIFVYVMAAFARRVADRPNRYTEHRDDAMRFITATIETYQAFRPELHLVEGDAHAFFTVPAKYAQLKCNGNHACEGYRATAGKPLAYNENLSMMKALADLALASDSGLYRGSADATTERLDLATKEVPLVISKDVAFFVDNLQSRTLDDGTPYFEWHHQLPSPSYIQNIPHAQFELGSLAVILENQLRLDVLLARAGRSERVPLTPSIGAGFANTFLRKVWRHDVLSENVDGSGDEGFNVECAGWIPLAQFDPWVWIRSRDTTFHNNPPNLRADNHGALLRYRGFNAMKFLTEFAGQNWLMTPAALAVGEKPPSHIKDQKWLLVLSGVVMANLRGDNTGNWNHQTVSFAPDMAGPDDPSATSGPLNWAISHYEIPRPAGAPGRQYVVRFSVDGWAPFASPSAMFNAGESINSGFAVDVWRPSHFGSGTNVSTNQPVNNIFSGIDVDLAVRDTDAWLYRLGYNITLIGRIVFVAPAF
jgi:hypothetical protein